jgi:hypothetical protein
MSLSKDVPAFDCSWLFGEMNPRTILPQFAQLQENVY